MKGLWSKLQLVVVSQMLYSLPRLLASPSFGGKVVEEIHWALLPCLSHPGAGDGVKRRMCRAVSHSAQGMRSFRIIWEALGKKGGEETAKAVTCWDFLSCEDHWCLFLGFSWLKTFDQVSPAFQKFALHHFSFMKHLYYYLFFLTERKLERIFPFTKKAKSKNSVQHLLCSEPL